MPLGIHNPLPSSLSSECKKAGKILASFIDPRQAFGPDKIIPPEILAGAKGLAILTVLKAGFLGSARFGSGIVVARLADGTWSAPSAIATAGAGFGGQIGFELTDFVFILNDAAAVRTFSQVGTLTLGGNVSIAAGPVGRNAEAAGAASTKGVAAVFSYSKTKGLFAGVSLEGSMLVERKDANEKMYNSRVSARQLLSGTIRPPPAADPLLRVLNSRAFYGNGRGNGDAMYNDIPVYDDRHDDVVWEGRRGEAYGEGVRRDRGGFNGGDDYEYRDQPRRANTWADDVYDRPAGGLGRSSTNSQADAFDRYGGRSRSNTAPFEEDYVYSDRKPSRPTAPKPVFGQRTGQSAPLRADQAIALYTFDADQEGDLGFKKGDIITILKRTDKAEDWWTGRIGDRVGIFPSDPSHHVTEAIGHMYEDDYDRRESKRLSFLSSPLSESISIIPPSLAGSEDDSSPQSLHVQNRLNAEDNRPANGHSRPPLVPSKSFDRDSSSPTSPGSTDTATTSFPLNDIDYESDPAAVAQELSNLAAIRRMSMDVTATGDPDLPSFSVPSIAPSSSADENDASRLFWVPARLHPELAPKEFKSFLESKTEQIRRKSGEFSPSGFERDGAGGSLRRKKSMLSRQIDTSQGYTDGAERLERKRSQSKNNSLSPNLLQLESLVDDSKQQTPSAASFLDGVQKLAISTEEDIPILPPAPPGHSLRRSTRTQYRKAGSLRKGEKVPYSKRIGKAPDANDRVPSITTSSADEPSPGLTRVATDPTPSTRRVQAEPQYTPQTAVSSSAQVENNRANGWLETDPGDRANVPSQARHLWHSRISSNGRSTLNIPPTEQRVPEIVETPPVESPTTPTTPTYHHSYSSGREAQHDAPPALPSKDSPLRDPNTTKRSGAARQSGKESSKTLNDFANNPQPLPGNTTRTDSLSFIPTVSEDRKPETKKSKDKKDSEGGRKSSWHWLLGSEEKEKDKDKERRKDKDTDSKKSKSKSADKVHEPAHLTSSNDISPRGRESIAVDRLDPKLEEERRKDHVRRTSGESKKDKESGLFSSIFGGGRKKNSGDGHHKKSSSRTLSPDPPVRELRPDVDYPWTRFSILEERAIYRMAHIKLANPRRALYSQVLLSNFMYSYLAKVQQMHPHMMTASSASQRQQHSRDQNEEYSQYQRYQESQQEQYSDSSYDDPQTYEYGDDPRDGYRPHSRGSKYENGNVYGPGHHQYGHSTFGDDVQLDDDDDDMW
ncbi:putative telomere silencing protein Zds1 [Aspergillus thermomutatus]|uniref:SH3 domain-containing protein n=1 Tax=Aspergillus thermomutatus TaxID=41047 RepID=A0A397HGA7_ASPTH|nr:uncharacterized protein CDV56_108837 [Aspergillus thermomutatus]RHZ62165.1 hypothetical protein CDV56_108837 [Aspergillus thermomutatus]